MTDEQLDQLISRSLVRQLATGILPQRLRRPAKCKCDVTASKVDAAIAKLDAETYKDPLARLDAGEVTL